MKNNYVRRRLTFDFFTFFNSAQTNIGMYFMYFFQHQIKIASKILMNKRKNSSSHYKVP